MVTTASDVVDPDDGQLSLREAVAQANATMAADTIVFAGALEGQTLTLAGGELVLEQDVTIDGDSNNDGVEITLSGGDATRILAISGSGTDVKLGDVTLANGRVEYFGSGGAVHLGGGSLSLAGCTIRDSVSGYDGRGGGIYADLGSRVSIDGSAFFDNSQGGLYLAGGAIAGNSVELVVRNTAFSGNVGGAGGGAIYLRNQSTLTMEDCVASSNGREGFNALTSGGALLIADSDATIIRSSFSENVANFGGAISAFGSRLVVADCTIAGNAARHDGFYSPVGGGIKADSSTQLVIRNSTITSNRAEITYYSGPEYAAQGGGIFVGASSSLDIANSIVAGNTVRAQAGGLVEGADIFGAIALTDGHNTFGSDVLGNNLADRENVAPNALFAAIDPDTGGGLLSGRVVPLLDSSSNPALSGANPLAASATGQNGTSARPQPAGSLPDIGSIEINQTLSTTASARNDVLTGTSGANTISARAGNDYLKGLGGNDTLNGGDGSDLLEGGAGNDRLRGDGGIDLVTYAGATRVVVDLSLATDTARRGSETDTLTNVEGAIGSSAGDSFKGNGFNNYFQGGLGKDTFTGGGGRDLYDLNFTTESGTGTTRRDVITDFDHLVDDIDLMGMDGDTAIAGNQAFRWVGTAALTGPGQVGFFTAGGNTIIRGSNDADAGSEFEIQLMGMKTLTVDDFYL